MKLEFYRQVFEKYTNTKFDENPSMRKTKGQTDTEIWRSQ